MSRHVAVLKGGWSAEREVSLVSGAAVAEALRGKGYRVSEIDASPDLAADLARMKPDVVFNALHGRWGEDGCVQGLLEIMGLPYTHSGVTASAVAMDKVMAKVLFQTVDIPCAADKIVTKETLFAADPLPRPFVVKPYNEGSSVGVVIVKPGDNFSPEQPGPWQDADELMVESYLPGRELTVSVQNGKAMAVTELKPRSGFYDYEAKYEEGKTDHIIPAEIGVERLSQIMDYAERAHEVLGCRGVTRSDFRLDDGPGGNGIPYILEINTQPGMTPLSLVPEQARHIGIDFGSLVAWMVEDASCGR
ncbi:D-alanine--D-alanine ligase [Paremcibacter congregatus]|uniref:D-alanine--D-alanine ligase n=1 Tax=Paremcibacter congregatus TaxID=2043170 RepID=A0A2G4YTD4_9PROT|nr:D-alanine--D-alanine ligase [Paremcibacter congregatus]PHZ85599.1 D-alanine--D-alanine ligase [Paremcibacter congregatus]QDE26558.1 D-alanine--D-alanine ligase [Paremcibacter congregatus]